jgi:hypothetical protein
MIPTICRDCAADLGSHLSYEFLFLQFWEGILELHVSERAPLQKAESVRSGYSFCGGYEAGFPAFL